MKYVFFIFASIVLFLSFLYYVLKTKVVDVSEKKPYSEIVGKALGLKRPAMLFKSIDYAVNENPYRLIEEGESQSLDGAFIALIPKGTKFEVKQVKHFTNGTSGNTSAFVLGEVYIAEIDRVLKVEYRWGEHHSLCIEEPCSYWVYPLALWQEEKLMGKYFMK